MTLLHSQTVAARDGLDAAMATAMAAQFGRGVAWVKAQTPRFPRREPTGACGVTPRRPLPGTAKNLPAPIGVSGKTDRDRLNGGPGRRAASQAERAVFSARKGPSPQPPGGGHRRGKKAKA